MDHYDRAQVQRLLALDPLIGSYNVDFMTNLGTVVTYPRNHQSAAFTTDSLGFRVGDSDGRAIRVDELGLQDAGYGLVLGSSSAFGYGSSSDRQTIASHLSAMTGRSYYNLGVPGANSHQLLSVAAEYAARAEHIVIFSGWVSLLAELKTQRPHTPHGASIYERLVGRIENEPIFSLVAKLTGRMPVTPPGVGASPLAEPNMSRADLARRVQHAVSIQVLDAEILRRIAPPQAEITYVLQPLASPTRRQLVEEEQPLFDLELPILGDTRALLFSEWDSYAAKLRSAFHAAGISFLDVPANSLEGWSFHDMTHLTDGGYAQVAAQVARLMARVSA